MTIWGKHVIMKETLIVIISGREGSAPMVEKTIRRHPERMRRICTHGGESGKMLFNVKKTATYIGNCLLLSVGTGNSGDFINCVVELIHDFRIGGFVIHFFSVAAGCNQSAGFQQT